MRRISSNAVYLKIPTLVKSGYWAEKDWREKEKASHRLRDFLDFLITTLQ
jgi:hypothetical protein